MIVKGKKEFVGYGRDWQSYRKLVFWSSTPRELTSEATKDLKKGEFLTLFLTGRAIAIEFDKSLGLYISIDFLFYCNG